jgi:hypothetical protein
MTAMLASRVIYAQPPGWRQRRERLVMWTAWHLPAWLAYWCFVRVAAHATAGEWSGTVPDQLNVMEAMRRFDGRQL